MGCSSNHLSHEIKRESNLKLPENSDSEPKNISPQDLLQSNTNFYSQSLELLIAQTIFICLEVYENRIPLYIIL